MTDCPCCHRRQIDPKDGCLCFPTGCIACGLCDWHCNCPLADTPDDDSGPITLPPDPKPAGEHRPTEHG